MSHTRNKSTSSILVRLNETRHTHQKQTRISLSLFLKAIMLFLLSKADVVKATLENAPPGYLQKDILHLLTNTWYRLNYPNDGYFDLLPKDISDACHAVIYSEPINRNFTPAASTPCTWMNEPTSPPIIILVEEGKELSSLFADCFDEVMKPLCNAYNAAHTRSTEFNNNIYFIFIPIAFLIMLGCLLCCYSQNKKNTLLGNKKECDYHQNEDNLALPQSQDSLLKFRA
jgi:hypothetical protein